MDTKKLFSKKRVIKGAAMIAAVAVMATAALIPAKTEELEVEPVTLQPDPVVMILDEPADAVVEETQEEEEERKLSFIQKLKIAVYGFFAVCAGWIAHKIPWKKIFNKKTLILVGILVVLGLAAYHIGLPMLKDYIVDFIKR